MRTMVVGGEKTKLFLLLVIKLSVSHLEVSHCMSLAVEQVHGSYVCLNR